MRIPREDEERAEDVDYPVEAVDERRAHQDHHRAHHQRAQHAPKEDAVLVFAGDAKIREDQKEDEEIVDREREFDKITGQKLYAFDVAELMENARRKDERQRNPNDAPSDRLTRTNNARSAIEEPKIDSEQ